MYSYTYIEIYRNIYINLYIYIVYIDVGFPT